MIRFHPDLKKRTQSLCPSEDSLQQGHLVMTLVFQQKLILLGQLLDRLLGDGNQLVGVVYLFVAADELFPKVLYLRIGALKLVA